MVSTDHELRGDRCAVGTGGEVGDVSLDPGQRARLGFQFAVDGVGIAAQLDEPVPLDRGLARDGFLRLGDLVIDPPQRAPRPVVPVLVIDDLVPAAAGSLGIGGRPGLGEDMPVGDCLLYTSDAADE